VNMSSTFRIDVLNSYLRTRELGHSVTFLEETDSTMNDAKKIFSLGYATHGQIILANFQTAGRGRVEGRSWESAAAKNILCTLLLRKDKVICPENIPFVTACAITLSLRKFGLNAAIKWPNDVIVAGKKISSIMINDEGSFFAVGFGVNVNERFGKHYLNTTATSILDTLQHEIQREEILASILNNLVAYLPHALGHMVEVYTMYSAITIGSQVTIYPKGKEHENILETGILEEFDDWGVLTVKVAGHTKKFSNGVSMRSHHFPEYLQNPLLPRPDVRKTIDGEWRSTLGLVTFETHDDSTLTGYYQLIEGNCLSRRHPLSGRFTLLPNGNALLGWIVTWKVIPKSITTWSATFSLNEKLDFLPEYKTTPYIISTWFELTSNNPQRTSVLTNKDYFYKIEDDE